MTQPTLSVELGRLEGWVLGESLLGTDTTLAEYVYEDITSRVIDLNIRRGRQHELDRIEAGTLSGTLMNQDGAFNPLNTLSPFYPDIRPMVPLRIRASFFGGPNDIAGLVGWWDFSDASTLFEDTARTDPVDIDTDVIKGVTDKSGTGSHLSEATNGPQYKVSIQNGLSVARFDGTNDLLTATVSADASRTIFLAARQRSVNTASIKAWLDINDVRVHGTTSGAAQVQVASFSHLPGVVNFPGSIDVQTAAIYVVRGNSAASLDLFTNAGGSATNGDPHDNWTSGTTLDLGSRAAGIEPADVDIYEVVSYNTALSVTDINSIGGYLGTKWGITWTPVT